MTHKLSVLHKPKLILSKPGQPGRGVRQALIHFFFLPIFGAEKRKRRKPFKKSISTPSKKNTCIYTYNYTYIYISLNFKLLQKHFLRVPLLFYRTVAAICLVMRQPGVCLPWRDIQSHEIGPLSLAKQQSAGTEMSSELLN